MRVSDDPRERTRHGTCPQVILGTDGLWMFLKDQARAQSSWRPLAAHIKRRHRLCKIFSLGGPRLHDLPAQSPALEVAADRIKRAGKSNVGALAMSSTLKLSLNPGTMPCGTVVYADWWCSCSVRTVATLLQDCLSRIGSVNGWPQRKMDEHSITCRYPIKLIAHSAAKHVPRSAPAEVTMV